MSIRRGDTLVADKKEAAVMFQYIRNQTLLDMTNEASKFNINGATSAATAIQMPYDGILNIQTPYNIGVYVFVLDKNKQQKYVMRYNGQGHASGDGGNLVFCKGDYLYFINPASASPTLYFYKKRDYTGR